AAGTDNAEVSLWLVRPDGTRTEGGWDAAAYLYLVTVHWSEHGRPLVQVLSRRQELAQVLAVDLATGDTELVRELSDEAWVDVVPGTRGWASDGRLLTVEVADDRYALCVDGSPVSPPGQQVRRLVPAGDRVLVHCSEASGDEQVHAWSPAEGFVQVSYGSGS